MTTTPGQPSQWIDAMSTHHDADKSKEAPKRNLATGFADDVPSERAVADYAMSDLGHNQRDVDMSHEKPPKAEHEQKQNRTAPSVCTVRRSPSSIRVGT